MGTAVKRGTMLANTKYHEKLGYLSRAHISMVRASIMTHAELDIWILCTPTNALNSFLYVLILDYPVVPHLTRVSLLTLIGV